MEAPKTTYILGNNEYEVIKPTRLGEGMVLKSGDTYARLGPKSSTLEEQVHTVSLRQKGFPVAEVIESGEYGNDEWYFVEKSLGDETFHKKFCKETTNTGFVSNETFQSYMAVIDAYTNAQLDPKNQSNIKPAEFVGSLLVEGDVLSSYCYFGYEAEDYRRAIKKVVEKLQDAPMGILQYDLNPYNILEGGVIDFELVGYGPVGYDVLMSARWGGTWFTNYPSRYPKGYALSEQQISATDHLVRTKSSAAGITDPTTYMEEFLLLKTAWSVMEREVPQPDLPQDKLAFRRFRSNLLHRAIVKYLQGEPIDYWNFADIPDGEV